MDQKQIIEQLKQIIRDLSQEIRDLRSENESLWLVLDEIKESDKALKSNLGTTSEEVLMEYLYKQKTVGDA
jgi:prefoldin subunit 5|tara:strand:+ start:142 stop:354 length:213 start_codon:yes stop_codon:yes gene_type:complete